MKTGMGLVLIGIGAIFAFAVTTNTPVFNLHTAGYVIMVIGVLGLAIPRRGYGWVGRRLLVRRARLRPRYRIQEVTYPDDVDRDPAGARVPAGLRGPGVLGSSEAGRHLGAAAGLPRQEPPGETEIIEDIYET